jgi:hypothetical protein
MSIKSNAIEILTTTQQIDGLNIVLKQLDEKLNTLKCNQRNEILNSDLSYFKNTYWAFNSNEFEISYIKINEIICGKIKGVKILIYQNNSCFSILDYIENPIKLFDDYKQITQDDFNERIKAFKNQAESIS